MSGTSETTKLTLASMALEYSDKINKKEFSGFDYCMFLDVLAQGKGVVTRAGDTRFHITFSDGSMLTVDKPPLMILAERRHKRDRHIQQLKLAKSPMKKEPSGR